MSLTSIRLSAAWNWGGLTARELAVRTYERIVLHETLDRAAALAFYAMLSLVPFLGFFLAIGVGGRGTISSQLLRLSREFLPPAVDAIIADQVHKIQAASSVGLLSFSSAVLLWSASSVFVSVMDATNAAHGVRDGRPWWKRWLMAVVLTVIEAALLTGALLLIVVWPFVTGFLGLGAAASAVATVARWTAAVVALLASFAVAYYFGPDVRREWKWITPGSALGVLGLIAASVGLQLYVYYGHGISETYGALAGVILLLLWLYAAALALLVGVEIDCIIEQATQHGHKPGASAASPGRPPS